MRSALTILFLIPTFFAQKHSCTDKTIRVVDSWSLPLTAVADHQFCIYNFEFSNSNQYALMTIQAFDLAVTSEGRDSIIITQNGGFGDSSAADKSSTFYSTEPYGVNFGIWVETLRNGTNMKLQVDIQLYKSTYGQNMVETITVGRNQPASVRYFSDLIVGGTYQLSGSRVLLSTAYAPTKDNDSYSLGNVFVYSNGVMSGSLYDMYKAQSNPGGGVDLGTNAAFYVVRPIPISKGAIIINDLDNFNHVYQTFNMYVPITQPMATSFSYIEGDLSRRGTQKDGALTIIGEKDGSTPFDVREFKIIQDLGGAYFSSASGAPMSDHQNATKINPLQVPMHFTGNLNTIYITNGSGRVKVTVQ